MEDCARTAGGSGGLQGLVTEFGQGVVAALEQLASDGQAGGVATEPRGRLLVVGVVGAARATCELRRLIERLPVNAISQAGKPWF